MWKVSFIPLVFGALCVFAGSLGSHTALAQVRDPMNDVMTANGPQPHVHRMPKHARARGAPRYTGRVPTPALPPAPPLDPPSQADIGPAPRPPAALPALVASAPSRKPAEAAEAANPPPAARAERPATEVAAAAPRPAAVAAKPKPAAASPPPLPREIRQFCANSASGAIDARVAWQAAKLTELEAKLKQRIAEFEAKRAEYEDWLHKHDEAMKQAKEDVVSIYSKMRPDAAAAQMAVMDDVTAASLLTKLNSRVASSILAEMDPGRAARITNAMVGPLGAAGGKKS
ncbi:MAG: MotE family protein [Methylovirgula sp.]